MAVFLIREQLSLYKSSDIERRSIERKFFALMREDLHLGPLVSYVNNKYFPILGLYRYKEAFAFEFVNKFVKKFGLSHKDYVFDPFAGMGTTLFCSYLNGIPSIGIDRMPIAVFVAEGIHHLLFVKSGQLRSVFIDLEKVVSQIAPANIALDVPIMSVAFNDDVLMRLRCWKAAIDAISGPLRDIFLLLFFSILEGTSYTSKNGQFLRLKRDKRLAWPDDLLAQKVAQAEEDIERIKQLFGRYVGKQNHLPQIILGDTRELNGIPFERPPTAIITSPPYANRYDYTRSYCLELCFHFVKNFEELKAIRFAVLRSHIESKVFDGERPAHPVIEEVVDALNYKNLNNPRIPYMLIGYFNDMKKAIQEWGRILAPGAQVAVVVDNVRFEGELIPVDLVLSDMAEMAGFEVKEIIISRYKGNSSQQMKKYGRVPARESVVVWKKI